MAQGAGSGESRRHVVGIGSALIIPLVAGVAVRRRSRILAIDVAAGAGHGGMGAGERKTGAVVIETGRNPRRRVVAYLALLRKPGGCVVRIVGVLEILEVTGHAQGTEIRKLSAHMAGLALQRGMRAGEWKTAQSVVEGGVSPGNRAVADGAIRREPAADVVGVGRLLKIGHVARRTRGRHGRVTAVYMALRAGHLGMRAAQRPAGHGVIEVHVHPRTGVVAGGAVGGKSGGDVIGIAGGGPIFCVAAQAVYRRALEAAAYVAGGAVQRGMHAGEGKPGEAQVIKLRSEPGVHAVALLAGSGKT